MSHRHENDSRIHLLGLELTSVSSVILACDFSLRNRNAFPMLVQPFHARSMAFANFHSSQLQSTFGSEFLCLIQMTLEYCFQT